MIEFKKKDRTRFERFFVPEPMSGCWLWTGSVFKSGYGVFPISRDRQRTCLRAHRAAWRLYVGPIPEGLHVLHRCDTPPCVNPEHLFLGTHADNMEDCVAKGRRPALRGRDNPAAKLTPAEVAAIRSDRRTQTAIAVAFGVSQAQVGRIKRQESWHGH